MCEKVSKLFAMVSGRGHFNLHSGAKISAGGRVVGKTAGLVKRDPLVEGAKKPAYVLFSGAAMNVCEPGRYDARITIALCQWPSPGRVVYTYQCTGACVYVYVCMYVCVCICECI